MAFQEGERAKKMENPGMRGPIERTAQRFAALAEKFEAAHRRSVDTIAELQGGTWWVLRQQVQQLCPWCAK